MTSDILTDNQLQMDVRHCGVSLGTSDKPSRMTGDMEENMLHSMPISLERIVVQVWVRRTSDCGSGRLDSDIASEFFPKHGVQLTLTTAYNLEANGKIERGHSPLVKALAKACDGRVKDWS